MPISGGNSDNLIIERRCFRAAGTAGSVSRPKQRLRATGLFVPSQRYTFILLVRAPNKIPLDLTCARYAFHFYPCRGTRPGIMLSLHQREIVQILVRCHQARRPFRKYRRYYLKETVAKKTMRQLTYHYSCQSSHQQINVHQDSTTPSPRRR